jgi:hypothetical protein
VGEGKTTQAVFLSLKITTSLCVLFLSSLSRLCVVFGLPIRATRELVVLGIGLGVGPELGPPTQKTWLSNKVSDHLPWTILVQVTKSANNRSGRVPREAIICGSYSLDIE